MTERLHFHFSLSSIGEGNGNLLHYSCLENPRNGGAWWAAICGVAQSRTRLKQLSSSNSSVICIFFLAQPLLSFFILSYHSSFYLYPDFPNFGCIPRSEIAVSYGNWIPWTEEPGRLQSTGSQGVGHDWATFSDSLMVILCFNLLRTPQTVVHSGCTLCTFHMPTSSIEEFQFFHILASTSYFPFLIVNYCEVESHCGFNLHFLND